MALYTHHATVKGFGEFPVDMLRYDACFPATEGDSGIIANESGHRTVKVAKINDRRWDAFTAARWESFGWHLIEASTVKQ